MRRKREEAANDGAPARTRSRPFLYCRIGMQ